MTRTSDELLDEARAVPEGEQGLLGAQRELGGQLLGVLKVARGFMGVMGILSGEVGSRAMGAVSGGVSDKAKSEQ